MKSPNRPDRAEPQKEVDDPSLTPDEKMQHWNSRVIDGMNRMSQDENYRQEIAQKLS